MPGGPRRCRATTASRCTFMANALNPTSAMAAVVEVAAVLEVVATTYSLWAGCFLEMQTRSVIPWAWQ